MINTVLSIDDDSVAQTINQVYLEADGFCKQMLEAYNGQEALDFFKKLDTGIEPMDNFPDVIFLDLNMPVMEGWEFYEAFKTEYPHFLEKTKVFILSSSINPLDAEKAKNEKHIVSFLPKPINQKSLELVRELLGI